jgi:3-keto-L-gulonate-6-phosphate decarboxylase
LEQVVKNTDLALEESATPKPTAQDVETAIYKLEKDLQIAAVKKANIIEVSIHFKIAGNGGAVLKQLSEFISTNTSSFIVRRALTSFSKRKPINTRKIYETPKTDILRFKKNRRRGNQSAERFGTQQIYRNAGAAQRS